MASLPARIPLLLRYRRPVVVVVQLLLVVAVYVAAFLVRYDFQPSQIPTETVLKSLPLLLAARIAAMGLFHLYQGLWRYVSVKDLWQIMKASTAGSLVFIPVAWLLFGPDDFPAGVFPMEWAGNILALGAVRVAGILARETLGLGHSRPPGLKRLLIIGAGDAGAVLCREAQEHQERGYLPVAFIDDAPWKARASVHGVPVLGNRDEIPRVCEEQRADVIFIAIPSATREQMRGIVERCRETGLPFTTLPAIPSILAGRVSLDMLRQVDITDLLGRAPVELDRTAIGSYLQGKRILVTGAAGSIGSELARQIASFRPELLILLDRAENPLFFFEDEFRRSFSEQPFVAEIGDVCEYASLCRLIEVHRPHIVFHAAAHKHVPLMERTPAEAVRNNVMGTYNLALASQRFGVERFVLISTDKAVKPTSVMGATKRVAELLLRSMNHKGQTRLVAVRFGNVLGSNASVVPIFQEQIARGGPVTVTHAEARRYFMTIPEAAQLVLQAGALGTGGEIFVLDMGQPVRILDLARELITLSGRVPDKDIPIVFTGLRPGEKLTEELALEGKDLLPTSHPKLRVLLEEPPARDMEALVSDLGQRLAVLSPDQVREELGLLVPEYRPGSAPPGHLDG
ncbi:MAG: polysaccharide biosynthesis protein [Chloroflexi bacterium]|nr:polysaccharide biosynthesis protein [Chloroflexota bacterium]